jgi:hypothetical protein
MRAKFIKLVLIYLLIIGVFSLRLTRKRKSTKKKFCRRLVVIQPQECPSIPILQIADNSAPTKTPKSPKGLLGKLINISIKDLIKTLIMTLVSLLARVLFEQKQFQNRFIRAVSQILRLAMTISAYAVTDVISGCILATIKITVARVLYKILLVRSYRIILKQNFKYLLGLGISKVNETRIGSPSKRFTSITNLNWLKFLLNSMAFLLFSPIIVSKKSKLKNKKDKVYTSTILKENVDPMSSENFSKVKLDEHLLGKERTNDTSNSSVEIIAKDLAGDTRQYEGQHTILTPAG